MNTTVSFKLLVVLLYASGVFCSYLPEGPSSRAGLPLLASSYFDLESEDQQDRPRLALRPAAGQQSADDRGNYLASGLSSEEAGANNNNNTPSPMLFVQDDADLSPATDGYPALELLEPSGRSGRGYYGGDSQLGLAASQYNRQTGLRFYQPSEDYQEVSGIWRPSHGGYGLQAVGHRYNDGLAASQRSFLFPQARKMSSFLPALEDVWSPSRLAKNGPAVNAQDTINRRMTKRSPACIRRCLRLQMLHPAQCNSLC